MLRAPLLSHPHLRLSSLAVLSRSVVQILNSYASFAHTSFFLPTWGEIRRISTAGYLMCICYWEREMERTESETLAGVADALLSRLEVENTFALGARGNLRKLCTLLGMFPRYYLRTHISNFPSSLVVSTVVSTPLCSSPSPFL